MDGKGTLAKFGFVYKEKSTSDRVLKRKISKDNYENRRKRGFVPGWRDQFPGIEDTENGMVCTWCQSDKHAPSTAFTTGCTSYRIESIRVHWESPRHRQCVAAARVQQGRQQGPIDIIIRKIGERNKSIVEQMFNTAYAILKHEMPFTNYPIMMEVQAKNGSDLRNLNSYATHKACAR